MKETQEILSNLEGDHSSYMGTILLNDGTKARGMISYNDRTAVVSFKSNSKSGTYNARNLTGFEFYDSTARSLRTFYSMEYEMRDGGSRTLQFFEVVRQYKDFAVMIKVDPISIKKRTGVVEASVLGDYARNRVVVSNALTVYFINESFGIRPYFEVATKEVSHINKLWNWDIFAGETTHVRVLDKDLPKELMGDSYKKVDKFAKEKKLYWEDKNGLLEILDYYESLQDL